MALGEPQSLICHLHLLFQITSGSMNPKMRSPLFLCWLEMFHFTFFVFKIIRKETSSPARSPDRKIRTYSTYLVRKLYATRGRCWMFTLNFLRPNLEWGPMSPQVINEVFIPPNRTEPDRTGLGLAEEGEINNVKAASNQSIILSSLVKYLVIFSLERLRGWRKRWTGLILPLFGGIRSKVYCSLGINSSKQLAFIALSELFY